MIFPMCIFAYAIGSINPAIIISKVVYEKDVRNFGDGNPGATNLFLNFGKSWGIIAGMFDISKGFLLAFLSYKAGISEILIAVISLFVILGHQYPVFHKFKGGTGIAATIGVLLFFNERLLIATLILSFILVFMLRIKNFALERNISVLEVGEAFGFIIVILYSVFYGTLALKFFILSDVSLIVVKRHYEATCFLSLKYFSNKNRY